MHPIPLLEMILGSDYNSFFWNLSKYNFVDWSIHIQIGVHNLHLCLDNGRNSGFLQQTYYKYLHVSQFTCRLKWYNVQDTSLMYTRKGKILLNPLNYWWLSTSPLTYKTRYSTLQNIENRLNNPLRRFWRWFCWGCILKSPYKPLTYQVLTAWPPQL